MDNLGRLLAAGYGVAAFAGAALAVQTGSVLGGALLFWFGGPALVLALAAAPGRLGAPFRRSPREGRESRRLALDAELARWEADRLADSAARPPERKAAGG